MVAAADLPGAGHVAHWYQIAGVDVKAPAGAQAIITLGDWATARPYLNYAAYFPSKGAIEAMTRSLAVELVFDTSVKPSPAPLVMRFDPPLRVSVRFWYVSVDESIGSESTTLTLAIGVFLFEQRKERENEDEATWQQLSDAYVDFLEVVLAHPDLNCAATPRRRTFRTSSASACG